MSAPVDDRGPAVSAREVGLALLGALGLAVALFREAVLEGRILYERDIHLLWYPVATWLPGAALEGSFPLWNPYVGFGQPHLANTGAQLLYPSSWLTLLLDPGVAFTAKVVLHLVFAGIGAYLLARELGTGPLGAATAGALWMTSGPLLSLVNLLQQLDSAAWIPWAALTGERALRERTPRAAVRWGLAVAGLTLAGSPDVAAMTGVLLAVRAALAFQGLSPRHPANGGLLRTGALAVAVAASVTAVQWATSLAVVRASTRWGMAEATRTTWSLHPLALLQALLPVHLQQLPLTEAQRAALDAGREPLLASCYLGAATVALVGASLAGSRRRAAAFLLATAAATAVLALGRHTPVHAIATALAPPLQVLRYPVRWLVMAAFAWAIAAGLGVDAWACGPDRRRAVRFAIACGTATALVGLVLLAAALRVDAWGVAAFGAPPAGRAWSEALADVVARLALGVGLAVAVAALALLDARRAIAWIPAAAAVLAVADTGVLHRALNPTVPRALLGYRPPALDHVPPDGRLYVYDYYATGTSKALLGRDDAYRAREQATPWPPNVVDMVSMRSYLLPPVAQQWRRLGSFDHDFTGLYAAPLARLARASALVDAEPAKKLRLLQVGAVQRVVALHDPPFLARRAVVEGLFAEPIRVLDVPGTLPRTYVVGRARLAAPDDEVGVLLADDFDPRAELVLPAGSDVSGVPQEAPFSGTSRLVRATTSSVWLEATLSRPGWVVLVDAHDAGWSARVDGRAAPLLRANHAFRALRVEAGRHLVHMVYRPGTVPLAGAVSVLALAAALGTLVRPASAPLRSGQPPR